MRDHPAPRLSSLPSMDSHPCLPRCSVCESLELTARSKGSSSSTWILPSSGFVCSFSHPVSDGPYFLPDKIADSLLFSLLSPSLPVVPTTGQRNIPLIFLLACLLIPRCAFRGKTRLISKFTLHPEKSGMDGIFPSRSYPSLDGFCSWRQEALYSHFISRII